MRSSLPLAILLPALAAASIDNSQCLQSRAKELAVNAACGDKRNMMACFQKASSDVALEDILRNCLTTSGCTEKAATNEARFLATFCDGEPDELKKREGLMPRASDSSSGTTEATTTTSTTSTSSTSSSTTSTSTTVSSTATSTSTSTDSTASLATRADTTTATTSTTLVCSTETITMVKSCKTNDQYDCTSVSSTTSVCAASNFCTTDTSGNNICMLRQDGMTLSGAIVAVFLAVVLAGILGTIIFLCCQDRKEQKKLRARAEAAAIAKSSATSVRPEGRSVSANRTPSGGAAAGNPFAG